MVTISSTAFSRFFICSLLSVSVVSASIPLISYETKTERKAIFFEQRILELLGKIFKYAKKKNAKKAIGKLIEMKEEMENHYNTRLSFSDAIDQIQNDLKANGTPFTKNRVKKIKKFFHDKWKHRKNRSKNFLEDNEMKIEKGDPVELDVEVQIGVTAMCAGFFLVCIPIPICTAVGAGLMEFGFGVLAAYKMNDMKKYKKSKTLSFA